MPYTPFSAPEVRLIFQMSEGNGGHAGSMHVNMSKDELWKRVQDFPGPGLALRTSFVSFAEQVDAAVDLLNDPANDGDLERFRVSAKAGDRNHFELKNRPLSKVVRMHYGMGGGAKLYPCTCATMILHKKPGNPRDMRIVTFFGTMGPMV